MTTSHLKSLDAEALRKLSPAIREAWRTDNVKVFLAILIKVSLNQDLNHQVIIAGSRVIAFDWLSGYLEEKHKAIAADEDTSELIISLIRESLTLSLEIS